MKPDILLSVNKLARAVTKLTKACGKRLARLISYIHHTCEYRQYCYVGNTAKQCRSRLFQDSDFARDLEDSKSTSGGILCVFGSHTFVPTSWMCKKQTSVSHLSTEAEVICPRCKFTHGWYSRSLSFAFSDLIMSFRTEQNRWTAAPTAFKKTRKKKKKKTRNKKHITKSSVPLGMHCRIVHHCYSHSPLLLDNMTLLMSLLLNQSRASVPRKTDELSIRRCISSFAKRPMLVLQSMARSLSKSRHAMLRNPLCVCEIGTEDDDQPIHDSEIRRNMYNAWMNYFIAKELTPDQARRPRSKQNEHICRPHHELFWRKKFPYGSVADGQYMGV